MWIGVSILLVLVNASLILFIYQNNKKVQHMNIILKDILEGNLDRKLIVKNHSKLAETYFLINEIVAKYKTQVVELQQSEKAYKQIVTNLSHDIRTPLSSLIGYLSAIEDEVVIGKEKEEFLKLSHEKAISLKEYIDTLFEWLKLESGERILKFEIIDICELTRTIMSDWILQLEQNSINYEIDIPDKEIKLFIDESAYCRILNNLLQNVLVHSQASIIKISINETEDKVTVTLIDNGIGISKIDLPHIFERLYRCDSARSGKGNGLGLAITNKLLKAIKGSIRVESEQGEGTRFIMLFQKSKR